MHASRRTRAVAMENHARRRRDFNRSDLLDLAVIRASARSNSFAPTRVQATHEKYVLTFNNADSRRHIRVDAFAPNLM